MHLITKYIRTSTKNVFVKILRHQLDSAIHLAEGELPETPLDGICGAVGFTGALNGTVYLLLSETFARACTLQLFGEKRCAKNDHTGDFVGEMTNMVAGYVKSRLGDRGMECKLTPPTLIRGKEIEFNATEPSMSFYNRFAVRDTVETVHVFAFVQIELGTWKSGLLDLTEPEEAGASS